MIAFELYFQSPKIKQSIPYAMSENGKNEVLGNSMTNLILWNGAEDIHEYLASESSWEEIPPTVAVKSGSVVEISVPYSYLENWKLVISFNLSLEMATGIEFLHKDLVSW